jgi:hypothetical protein
MSTADLQSPFCLEPVRKPVQFFGRRKEIRQVLSFLHWLQSVSIVGSAKIGKTSFLFHVAHPLVRAEHGLATEQVFTYFDCRSLVGLSQGECYLRIREETIQQIKNTESVDKAVGIQLEKAVREAGCVKAYYGLHTLFRGAQANDLRLVIILDHFEILAQSPCLEGEFFSGLRSLPTNYQMAYLVASQFPLYTLERVCPEASPFFNIFQPITLDPLTPQESRELVVTLLERAYVGFPDFIIDRILELGNNEPCRLQWAGHIAFQVWQESGEDLHVEHCEEIRQRFEESVNDRRREGANHD